MKLPTLIREGFHMLEDVDDQSGAESGGSAHQVTWFSAERPVTGTVSVRTVDDVEARAEYLTEG